MILKLTSLGLLMGRPLSPPLIWAYAKILLRWDYKESRILMLYTEEEYLFTKEMCLLGSDTFEGCLGALHIVLGI